MSSPWIDSWKDTVAGLKTFQPLCCFGDFDEEDDGKFAVVTEDNRLRVMQGVRFIAETELSGIASACCAYKIKAEEPHLIAVSCGQIVYTYKLMSDGLRPVFRFVCTSSVISTAETELWDHFAHNTDFPVADLVHGLLNISKGGTQLELSQSHTLLDLESSEDQQSFARAALALSSLQKLTVINCMTSCVSGSGGELRSLVLGTEDGHVIFLDQRGRSTQATLDLGAPIDFIDSFASDNIDHVRVIVGLRSGKVRVIRNQQLTSVNLQLDSNAVCAVSIKKRFYIGCFKNALVCFTSAAAINQVYHLPSPIQVIEKLYLREKNFVGVLIGLKNGEVRLYERSLMCTFNIGEPVRALRFGHYNRENTVIAIGVSGALHIKILSRRFQTQSLGAKGAPEEQSVPIDLPTRSKLFLNFAKLEESRGPNIHAVFQQQLGSLKLLAAEEYLKVLQEGVSTVNTHANDAVITMSCTLEGIGPEFLVRLRLINVGETVARNLRIAFLYNEEIYRIGPVTEVVPVLVPNQIAERKYSVTRTDEGLEREEEIRALLYCNKSNKRPIGSALINVPVSDLQ
ncbi:hypothetical protein PCE1_001303 [Barthelona sp. PCE]